LFFSLQDANLLAPVLLEIKELNSKWSQGVISNEKYLSKLKELVNTEKDK